MRNASKRFFKLLVIFLFFVGIFLFIEKIPVLLKKENKTFSFKKEIIKGLTITQEKEVVTLKNNNKLWLINDFPADKERVDKIIESLLNLKKEEIISGNKNKYKELEVDGKRKIEFGNHIVYIGKTYSYGKSYFRVDNDPNVYLADEDLSAIFYPKDFRDLKVYFVNDENKVDRIEERWGEKFLKLMKKESKWFVTTDAKLSFTKAVEGKKDRVDFFINDIKTLKGDEIFDKKSVNLSNYQVDLSIIVGEGRKEKKGVFYKKDEEKYYFYQEGSNYIYQIPAAYVASLKKEEKDLVE